MLCRANVRLAIRSGRASRRVHGPQRVDACLSRMRLSECRRIDPQPASEPRNLSSNRTPMIIRPAETADLDSLLSLRNYYISNSYATFDEELMQKEAVSAWIGSFSNSGPHRLFVATESGRLLGFAGSQQYRNHPAFQKTVETSIYVDPEAGGRGVGSAFDPGPRRRASRYRPYGHRRQPEHGPQAHRGVD